MHDWQSLAHVRWDCKYHVVIVPKYRRKRLYGSMRRRVGRILRQLCEQKGVGLIEGHAMADHVHLCLSIPPKFSWRSRSVSSRARARFSSCGSWSGTVGSRASTSGLAAAA